MVAGDPMASPAKSIIFKHEKCLRVLIASTRRLLVVWNNRSQCKILPTWARWKFKTFRPMRWRPCTSASLDSKLCKAILQ